MLRHMTGVSTVVSHNGKPHTQGLVFLLQTLLIRTICEETTWSFIYFPDCNLLPAQQSMNINIHIIFDFIYSDV